MLRAYHGQIRGLRRRFYGCKPSGDCVRRSISNTTVCPSGMWTNGNQRVEIPPTRANGRIQISLPCFEWELPPQCPHYMEGLYIWTQPDKPVSTGKLKKLTPGNHGGALACGVDTNQRRRPPVCWCPWSHSSGNIDLNDNDGNSDGIETQNTPTRKEPKISSLNCGLDYPHEGSHAQ